MFDVVIYNKNNIDGLHPHFWHRVPKTLWVSQVAGVGGGSLKVSFIMLIRCFMGSTHGQSTT